MLFHCFDFLQHLRKEDLGQKYSAVFTVLNFQVTDIGWFPMALWEPPGVITEQKKNSPRAPHIMAQRDMGHYLQKDMILDLGC